MSDESDYQEYLEYLEYQKSQGSVEEPAASSQPQEMAPLPGISKEAESMARLGYPKDYEPTYKDLERSQQGIDVAMGTGAGAASNEVIGKVASRIIPGALSKLKSFFAPAAKRSEVLDKVKDISKLEPYVADEVAMAKEMFNKKQIAPRMLEQEARIANSTVKIDPRSVEELSSGVDDIMNQAKESARIQPHGNQSNLNLQPSGQAHSWPEVSKSAKPKGYQDFNHPRSGGIASQTTPVAAVDDIGTYGFEKMYGKAPKPKYKPDPNFKQPEVPEAIYSAPAPKPIPTNTGSTASQKGSYTARPVSELNLPGKEALKVRQELNKVAGWKTHPGDATRAAATDTQAASAHQNIAKQFDDIDPAMGKLSQELQDAYTLQKKAGLAASGRNPVNTVVANNGVSGLAKKSRLAQYDKQAGSNLSQLGKDIITANDRLRPTTLADLFSIHGPKHAVTKIASPVTRGYDAAAQKLMPALDAASKSKLTNTNPELLLKLLSIPEGRE